MQSTVDSPTLGINQSVLIRRVASFQGGTVYWICITKPIVGLSKWPEYRGGHISGVQRLEGVDCNGGTVGVYHTTYTTCCSWLAFGQANVQFTICTYTYNCEDIKSWNLHLVCASDDYISITPAVAFVRPVLFTLATTFLLQVGCHDNHFWPLVPHHFPEISNGIWQWALQQNNSIMPQGKKNYWIMEQTFILSVTQKRNYFVRLLKSHCLTVRACHSL